MSKSGNSVPAGTFPVTSLNRTPKRSAGRCTLRSSVRHLAGPRVFHAQLKEFLGELGGETALVLCEDFGVDFGEEGFV